MMMVKKPKTHRAPHHAHDEPDEDFEDEPVAEAAAQPEAEASAVVAKASHTHDGSTGHPAMVLPASQVPQTHTQQTLSPTSVMSEVVRKFLWTAQSG
jgi:hypothetical protein